MADPVAVVRGAMYADLEQVNTISRNLANVSTPGFKALMVGEYSDAEPVDSAARGFATLHSVDQRAGSITATGTDSDVAIVGNGYFLLVNEQGSFLTRNGKLARSADGFLVSTINGAAVQGSNGPIEIPSDNYRIDTDGSVRVDDVVVGQIRLVEPQGSFVHLDAGLFAVDGTKALTATDYKLLQGYIEAANVDVGQEMLGLMEAQRHFQMTQKYLLEHDSLTKSTIANLGKP